MQIPSGAASKAVATGFTIVAKECCVAAEDLTEDTVFADIGIDSLCSMVISSRFREELELGFDAGFSLFINFKIVSKMSESLSGGYASESFSES